MNSLNNKNIKFDFIKRTKTYTDFKKIKEIEGGRIILLYYNLFEIYDLKTNKKICTIEGNFEEEKNPRYYDYMFNDLIELKNKNIILWSCGKIFYYKKNDKKYNLVQTINEVKQQKNNIGMYQIGYVEEYDLYNIVELDNNIIASCNSIGLKIYNYIENEYKLINVIPMFLDIKNLIQIEKNNFLIIHHKIHSSGGCCADDNHEFALSLYDLESNKINKIFHHKTGISFLGRSNYNFNFFLINDNFIYQICNFPYDIDDIERYKNKNLKFESNFNIFNIKTKKNSLDLKTSFRLISYYKDNLIFAQDYQNLNICYFNNNNIFISIYKFNFNNSNLCILKNNDLISYGEKKHWEEIKKNDEVVSRYCGSADYYYDYYKCLA